MPTEYLDFELELNIGALATGWPLSVVRSPAGNARGTLRLSADPTALRRTATPESAQAFGTQLFKALIDDSGIGHVYDDALGFAAARNQPLRLILRIVDPQLAVLPWELLYDHRHAEFLVLSQETPVVRYAEAPERIQPLTVAPPLRILGMAVDPTGTLRLDDEKQQVEDALAPLIAQGLVELVWLNGQTADDLEQELWTTQGPWHVFHFIGHGGFSGEQAGAGHRDFGLPPGGPAAGSGGAGYLLLAKKDGSRDPISATRLGRLFADHPPLRLVVLNACHGAAVSSTDLFAGVAGVLTRRGLPAVIAMQFALLDAAGVTLARVFYKAIAARLPVEAALTAARISVERNHAGRLDWAAPVLYLRAANGVLFETVAPPRPQASLPTPQPLPPTPIRPSPDPVAQPPMTRPSRPPLDELTGPQIKQFRDALLGAFDRESLAQMLSTELDVKLNQIVGGSNDAAVVFALIEWAQRQGRLDDLLDGALRSAAGNKKLQELDRTLRG